ncbi:MAG TPA: hypothetical protein VHR66_29890 [Gemmataceae bacterium]|nr:hypothetical protein [Gemmataceae bacterium]
MPLPTEFHMHKRDTRVCSYCGKDKDGYVVTCTKGTMTETFLCKADFDRMMATRSNSQPTQS